MENPIRWANWFLKPLNIPRRVVTVDLRFSALPSLAFIPVREGGAQFSFRDSGNMGR